MDIVRKKEPASLTEKQYRALTERLSYSSIKLYDTDRRRFHKEVVMGEKRVEKQSPSLIIGSLVHCLLAGGETYREKFHEAQCKPPIGQMLELCEELFTRSLRSMNADGIQQDSFSAIFSDGFNAVKYDYEGNEVKFKKKDMEKVLGMFTDTDAELYYKELIENYDRTTVTMSMVENAERLIDKLKSHPFTQEYANADTDDSITVYSELPILFEIDSVPLKCMPDKLIVRHNTKEIEPVDWKTSWEAEDPQTSYLKNYYWLQAGLYDIGINRWKEEQQLHDYKVLCMKYIFVDTQGFTDPVIFELSTDDIERAKRGFIERGRRYVGVDILLERIAWSVANGIWTTTKEIHENNGRIKARIRYGS